MCGFPRSTACCEGGHAAEYGVVFDYIRDSWGMSTDTTKPFCLWESESVGLKLKVYYILNLQKAAKYKNTFYMFKNILFPVKFCYHQILFFPTQCWFSQIVDILSITILSAIVSASYTDVIGMLYLVGIRFKFKIECFI